MRIANERLLDYFRGRPCDFCGKRPPSQAHHVYCRGFGSGSRLDHFLNVLSVCWECHGKYQADRKAGFDQIAEREGLMDGSQVQEIVWQILRAPKRVAQ